MIANLPDWRKGHRNRNRKTICLSSIGNEVSIVKRISLGVE